MTRDSLVFAASGAFFGLLVGWILGSQQGAGPTVVTPPPQAPPAQAAGAAAPPALDENRIQTLRAAAEADPADARPRTLLGDLYFDAERYEQAIEWYEASLAIDPDNPNVSTDLGVSYYYTDDPDRALAQFAHSLEVDPGHVKTLLNTGIVRAFGKQDLEGAAEAWRRVVELAPDSPEGRAAQQAIESMRGAHPGFGQDEPAPSGGG